MGLDIDTHEKRRILGSVVYPAPSIPHSFNHIKIVSIEMCSWLRCVVPYNCEASFTPEMAIRTRLWPSFNTMFTKAHTVLFTFDVSKWHNDMRRLFHKERYARDKRDPIIGEKRCPNTGKIYPESTFPAEKSEYLNKLSPTCMPVGWARMWNGPESKAALWRTIELALKQHIMSNPEKDVVYIVEGNDGRQWVYPPPETSPPDATETEPMDDGAATESPMNNSAAEPTDDGAAAAEPETMSVETESEIGKNPMNNSATEPMDDGAAAAEPMDDGETAEVLSLLMKPVKYGEGDLRAVFWAIHLSGFYDNAPAVVICNDFDLPLMGTIYKSNVCFMTSGKIITSKEKKDPFQYDRNHAALTAGTAKKKLGKNPNRHGVEIIDNTLFHSKFPKLAHRLQFVMLVCCAGRVDYCKSIARFGYKQSAILDYIISEVFEHGFQRHNWLSLVFDDDEPTKKYLVFNPNNFGMILSGITRNPKNAIDSVKEFSDEIHDIIYSVRYLAGHDMSATPAGPPVPNYDHNLFEGPESITDLISGKFYMPPTRFEELVATPADALPISPHTFYGETQANKITSASRGSPSLLDSD